MWAKGDIALLRPGWDSRLNCWFEEKVTLLKGTDQIITPFYKQKQKQKKI